MRIDYLPQLDGIRAIAIAAVLALHASYGFVRGGFLGVDLFFVLSGFLITSLLIQEAEEFGKVRLVLFYIRRFLRLYPALVITVIVTGLAWKYMPGTETTYPRMAFAALFYYADAVPHNSPLHHTWSLSIEEQFYIVWPFLLLLSLRLRRWRFLPPIFIFCTAILVRSAMILRHDPPWRIFPFPLARMDSLMTGALIAMAIANRNAVLSSARRSLWSPIGATALLVSVVLFFTVNQYGYALYAWGFTPILLLFGLWIASVVLQPPDSSWTNRLLSSRPMVYLGRRSYGIYLYHLPIFVWLENFRIRHSVGNLILITALRVGLSIAVAALSFRFVEKPVLKFKSRFGRRAAFDPAPTGESIRASTP